MLGNSKAAATVAVKDLAAAAAFYEGKLGLKVTGRESDQVVSYATGGTDLLVYRSQFAGTSQATSVTWFVGDQVDALAKQLAARGVRFERYDMPGITHEGDVHVGHGMRVAWFKDPDGNIHNLASG